MKVLKLDNLIPPHNSGKIRYSGSEVNKAESALIMIHGRGSNAESIIGLWNELDLTKTLVIAPQADSSFWYPYRFIEPREKNQHEITSAFQLLDSIIVSLNDAGIPHQKVFLLGFSQGACIVLDYAIRHPKKYGGVFALSGGLIGDLNSEEYSGNLKRTPVFVGCSTNDFHIPEQRVHDTAEIFEKVNADVTKKLYENMGHTIIQDEIDIINSILNNKNTTTL